MSSLLGTGHSQQLPLHSFLLYPGGFASLLPLLSRQTHLAGCLQRSPSFFLTNTNHLSYDDDRQAKPLCRPSRSKRSPNGQSSRPLVLDMPVFTTSPLLLQEQRPLEPPSDDQVQVRIKCTTTCGSDQHYYVHGRNGDFALQHPMCLGHESSVSFTLTSIKMTQSRCRPTNLLLSPSSPQGIITSLGPSVPSSLFSIGDRVALEVGLYCKTCPRCLEGRYNLCPSMRFASSAKTTPHLDGTLQRWMNWPSWGVHL